MTLRQGQEANFVYALFLPKYITEVQFPVAKRGMDVNHS